MPKRITKVPCKLQCLGVIGARNKSPKKKRVLSDISNLPLATSTPKKPKRFSFKENVAKTTVNSIKKTVHLKKKQATTTVEFKVPTKVHPDDLFAKDLIYSTTQQDGKTILLIHDLESVAKWFGFQDKDERVHPVKFQRGLSCSDSTTMVYASAQVLLIVAVFENDNLSISATTMVTDAEMVPKYV